MVGRSNFGSLVEERQAICQRGHDRKPLDTMKGLPGNELGREENGFVWKATVCHLVLMWQTEIVQSLRRQRVWGIHTDHCRWAQLIEENITLCSLDLMQTLSHWGRCDKNDRGGGMSVIMRSFYTGTSGIILPSSSVIYWRGTWDFKNSYQNEKIQIFQFNRQTPSNRELNAQSTERKIDLMGSTQL